MTTHTAPDRDTQPIVFKRCAGPTRGTGCSADGRTCVLRRASPLLWRCFWGMAFLLGWLFPARPEYVMSMASGCLLLGPFLAMGLYDTSRRREAGLGPELGQSITCWDKHLGSMGMLVLVLIVLELLWGRASLVVFAVFFNTGMPSTTGVVQGDFQLQN